jgi:hypothetical protein
MAEESEILEMPAHRLRQALAELPGVSEPIVRAFIKSFVHGGMVAKCVPE